MSVQTGLLPRLLSGENIFEPKPFSDVLTGEHAFYNHADYYESTQKDFKSKVLLPVVYTWNTEHIVFRIVKLILAIIIFPIAIYQLLHTLVGKVAILPSSSPSLMGYSNNHCTESRLNIYLKGEWKYKRITVKVDGIKIDAMIVGKASTLGNGRWVLASNGNGEFYEDKLGGHSDFNQTLNELNGNAIVFNYPGSGISAGWPTRNALSKAYRIMLRFLEDEKKGIGAKEIIGYGLSIGCGVQGDALKSHKLNNKIKYVFVKRVPFSSLADVASAITCWPVGLLVRFLGWNQDTAESSKKLKAPEIIMQTARVWDYEELTDSSKIIHDGVIPEKATLAKVLLDDKKSPRHNKLFIGMLENHNGVLKNPSYLSEKINMYLLDQER